MEVKITDLGNWKRELYIEVPANMLAPKLDVAYAQYQKKIRLEGFRKGKVPLSLIKKMFGKRIESEVVESFIAEIYATVRDEKGLKPITPAKIKDISYSSEEGLRFKAEVEVEPEFELKDYKNLSVEKEVYQVSDKDVEQALEQIREEQAVMSNVEGEAREGHYILADLQQVDQAGIPMIGEKYVDRYLQLGSENLDAALSEQLIGVKPGEVRRVRIYRKGQNKEQDAHYFAITVKEIKEKKLPELDDELAKDAGNFESLEDLKAYLKKRLEIQTQIQALQRFHNRVADEVIKNNPFELPESMITNYLDALVETLKKEDSSEEIDENTIRSECRATAIWNLKWILIKDKIAELEGISVTHEEVDQRIKAMIEANKEKENQIRDAYQSKEARIRLASDLLEEKIIQFLVKNARVKEKVIKREDIEKKKQLII